MTNKEKHTDELIDEIIDLKEKLQESYVHIQELKNELNSIKRCECPPIV